MLAAVLASAIPAAPVVALMTIGVLVAIFGHITKIRGAIVLGLAILFLATAAMMLFAFAAYQNPDDNRDTRPSGTPGQSGF